MRLRDLRYPRRVERNRRGRKWGREGKKGETFDHLTLSARGRSVTFRGFAIFLGKFMPPPINPRSRASSLCPRFSRRCACLLLVYSRLYICRLRSHGVAFAPWLRFAPVSAEEHHAEGFQPGRAPVPSLTGTYLRSHECMVRARVAAIVHDN